MAHTDDQLRMIRRLISGRESSPSQISPPPSALLHRYEGAPPIPRLVEGLQKGFTVEEEQNAARNMGFQRAVASHWRLNGPSVVMLARLLLEQDEFPFRVAMAAYLNEPEGAWAQRFLSWPSFQKKVGMARDCQASGRLRWFEMLRQWEARLHRMTVPLPAAQAHLADAPVGNFIRTSRFDDGMWLAFQAGDSDQIEAAVSVPTSEEAHSELNLLVLGHEGAHLERSLSLQRSDDYCGGKVAVSTLKSLRDSLGSEVTVIVVGAPLPDVS